MALFNRSHLFGLLLLASLPLDGAAALALASVQATPVESSISERSIEERLSRIAAAVQEREGRYMHDSAALHIISGPVPRALWHDKPVMTSMFVFSAPGCGRTRRRAAAGSRHRLQRHR